MTEPTVRDFTQAIHGAPEAVFRLLCPVREGEWLDGWAEACTLVWSASGVAEPGCVFRTAGSGGPDATWVITTHDIAHRVVEFAQFVGDYSVVTLRIEVADAGSGSAVAIRYTATPIDVAGAAWVGHAYAQGAFDQRMRWWEQSMNHFLATGTMLRAPTAGSESSPAVPRPSPSEGAPAPAGGSAGQGRPLRTDGAGSPEARGNR